MLKIWGRMQTGLQGLVKRLLDNRLPRESPSAAPKERRAMRYKDPYTGMGYFACLLIDKPPSKRSEYLLEISDRLGRQWLCCDMGKPAMEAAAIVLIYDSMVCDFAEAMGEPIGGYVLNRSTEEETMWQKWFRRIKFVHTPSIEALADVLSQEQN